MLRLKYLHPVAWHLSSSERRNVRGGQLSSQEHVSPVAYCQVMLLLACSDFSQQSFKRGLCRGARFLISGYSKKRLISSTFPGALLTGGQKPVCGSMRLVEGRSGPAFSPDHPLMLQRSNPVWTNWHEPGVARGQDPFNWCLLDIFSTAIYILYILECSVLSILHYSLFDSHCILY